MHWPLDKGVGGWTSDTCSCKLVWLSHTTFRWNKP